MFNEQIISSSFIKVTELTQEINIEENYKRSIFKWKMQIENISNDCVEFNYRIPFFNNHTLNNIEIEYGQFEKKTIIFNPQSKNIIKYDDDVARNNLTICASQINNNTSILELANFLPSAKIIVTIFFKPDFVEDDRNRYLSIPNAEKYDSFLYPNYSILINIYSKDINFNKIELEYNQEKHTSDIDNKTEIKANNVSFQSPFHLKMPLKNINPKYVNSLMKPADLFFFIDDSTTSDPMIRSQIIDFLSNLSANFRFNILKYGNSNKPFRDSMVNLDQNIILEMEEFLKDDSSPSNKSSTYSTYSFVDAYIDIFGPGSQQQKIKDINVFNTIAICLGSISDDHRLITSKIVPTFIIDPNQKYNTNIFAQKNSFTFLGPKSFGKSELAQSFKLLSKEIRSTSSRQKYQQNIPNQFIVNSINSFAERSQVLNEVNEKINSFQNDLLKKDESKLNNSKIDISNMNIHELLKKNGVSTELLKNPIIKNILEKNNTVGSFISGLHKEIDILNNSQNQQHVAFEEDNSAESDIFIAPEPIKSSIFKQKSHFSLSAISGGDVTFSVSGVSASCMENDDDLENMLKSTKDDLTDSQEITTTANDYIINYHYEPTDQPQLPNIASSFSTDESFSPEPLRYDVDLSCFKSSQDQEKETKIKQQQIQQQQIKMEGEKTRNETKKPKDATKESLNNNDSTESLEDDSKENLIDDDDDDSSHTNFDDPNDLLVQSKMNDYSPDIDLTSLPYDNEIRV